jgi:hypothetical protein
MQSAGERAFGAEAYAICEYRDPWLFPVWVVPSVDFSLAED